MSESLIEDKEKQVLFKDSQGGLIFPGFPAEQPGRDKPGEISRGQVSQDSAYYAVECGFYLHDDGGHQKVLIGRDVHLEGCLL